MYVCMSALHTRVHTYIMCGVCVCGSCECGVFRESVSVCACSIALLAAAAAGAFWLADVGSDSRYTSDHISHRTSRRASQTARRRQTRSSQSHASHHGWLSRLSSWRRPGVQNLLADVIDVTRRGCRRRCGCHSRNAVSTNMVVISSDSLMGPPR